MPRLKVSAVVACLSVALAVSASAQTSSVVLTAPYAPGSGAVTAFGYYMSPYAGTVDGTTQRLNCVDFFHEAFVGQQWDAIQTNLGAAIANQSLLANTRDGSNGLYSLSQALTVYEKVAWLTDQFPTNPASNPTLATAIQTAIWAISSNSPTQTYMTDAQGSQDFVGSFSTANADPLSTGYWINQANLSYNQQASDYYDKFNIVSDVNGLRNASAGTQEFVYSTPEPATLGLLATGMFSMAGVGFKRRRKNGADVVESAI